MKHILRISLLLGGAVGLSGCMDGPFYALKRVNPYYRTRWAEDREYGPTFEDRLNELRSADKQLAGMTAAEQSEWASKFVGVVSDDPSPEMRRQAVLSIAKLDTPEAERALNLASGDEVMKVRLAACTAWEQRGGAAARDMLLSMAKSDESGSVRQAAVASLASFKEPEVIRELGTLLDDTSPAMQFSASGSLATLTGQSFNGDVSKAKSYVGSLNLDAPANTAEGQLQNALPGLGSLPVLPASGSNSLPQLP